METQRTEARPALFDDVLRERHSCRAFRSDPVPAEVLLEVLELAQTTASWCNAQSWKVDLCGPETVERLSAALVADVRSGPGTGGDIPAPSAYVGEYLQRRRGSGFALYGALGIAREDKAARGRQMMRNYSFFGAPHVAIVSSPAELGPYGYVDCGGYVANLLNAAQSRGLGAIAQAAVVLRPAAVRSVLPIPEDRHLICGVAIGYEDADDPANGFRTDRARLDDVVRIFP